MYYIITCDIPYEYSGNNVPIPCERKKKAIFPKLKAQGHRIQCLSMGTRRQDVTEVLCNPFIKGDSWSTISPEG